MKSLTLSFLLSAVFLLTSCRQEHAESFQYPRRGTLELCPAGPQRIPKIIHQIWHQFPEGNAMPPPQYQQWTQELLANHPGWEYKLWNAENSRAFLAEHYPWFLKTYDGYSKTKQAPIKRVDAIRPLLMHHFGGVYIDMDQQNLHNIEKLLGSCELVVSEGDREHYIIVNGFLASVPGHPFWLTVLEEMPKRMTKPVSIATGPYLIHDTLHTYLNKNLNPLIKIYDPEYILPFAWNQEQTVLEQCKTSTDLCRALLPNSYIAMHYGNSWKDQK